MWFGSFAVPYRHSFVEMNMIGRLTSAALGAVVLLAGCAGTPSAETEAAAFAAIYNDGDEGSLAALQGSVVILDFWAVW